MTDHGLICTNWHQSRKCGPIVDCAKPAIAFVRRSLMKDMELCEECAEEMTRDGMQVIYYSNARNNGGSGNPTSLAMTLGHDGLP